MHAGSDHSGVEIELKNGSMLHLVGLPRAGAPLICFTGAEIAGLGEWLQFEYIEPSEFQRCGDGIPYQREREPRPTRPASVRQSAGHPGDRLVMAPSTRSACRAGACVENARDALRTNKPPSVWTGAHYQLANRIAWTLWLRGEGIDAVFAYVVFDDDRSHIPATRDELVSEAHGGFEALGLSRSSGLYATVALPATR